MSNKIPYGITKDGKQVSIYTIKNRMGMEASLLDFGATWVSMIVPDKFGDLRDVVLGHKDIGAYEVNSDWIGSFVGRVANRTENASFQIDGITYNLEKNDGENNLHSSTDKGLSKVMWDVLSIDESSITFGYQSPDGECGFPGNMDIQLTYKLSDAGEMRILVKAISDKKTIVNFTHHAYFNLNGEGQCLDTQLLINADSYTPVREDHIPTGEILPVEGTRFDFRTAKAIGGEFDTNFVLRGEARALKKAAVAFSRESGIQMSMLGDQPGVQLYTGNFMGECEGKGGKMLGKHRGFCLETHGFTNAINTPGFPSPIIEAGQEYKTEIIYKFETLED